MRVLEGRPQVRIGYALLRLDVRGAARDCVCCGVRNGVGGCAEPFVQHPSKAIAIRGHRPQNTTKTYTLSTKYGDYDATELTLSAHWLKRRANSRYYVQDLKRLAAFPAEGRRRPGRPVNEVARVGPYLGGQHGAEGIEVFSGKRHELLEADIVSNLEKTAPLGGESRPALDPDQVERRYMGFEATHRETLVVEPTVHPTLPSLANYSNYSMHSKATIATGRSCSCGPSLVANAP